MLIKQSVLTVEPVHSGTFEYGNDEDAKSRTVVVHQLKDIHAPLYK